MNEELRMINKKKEVESEVLLMFKKL